MPKHTVLAAPRTTTSLFNPNVSTRMTQAQPPFHSNNTGIAQKKEGLAHCLAVLLLYHSTTWPCSCLYEASSCVAAMQLADFCPRSTVSLSAAHTPKHRVAVTACARHVTVTACAMCRGLSRHAGECFYAEPTNTSITRQQLDAAEAPSRLSCIPQPSTNPPHTATPHQLCKQPWSPFCL